MNATRFQQKFTEIVSVSSYLSIMVKLRVPDENFFVQDVTILVNVCDVLELVVSWKRDHYLVCLNSMTSYYIDVSKNEKCQNVNRHQIQRRNSHSYLPNIIAYRIAIAYCLFTQLSRCKQMEIFLIDVANDLFSRFIQIRRAMRSEPNSSSQSTCFCDV